MCSKKPRHLCFYELICSLELSPGVNFCLVICYKRWQGHGNCVKPLPSLAISITVLTLHDYTVWADNVEKKFSHNSNSVKFGGPSHLPPGFSQSPGKHPDSQISACHCWEQWEVFYDTALLSSPNFPTLIHLAGPFSMSTNPGLCVSLFHYILKSKGNPTKNNSSEKL